MKISAIVLTYNEALHLARCLKSIAPLKPEIIVVDSFSTDKTLQIAHEFGATILRHEWTNYASQFNWALDQIDTDTDWVLRIDADEYLTPELTDQLILHLQTLAGEIEGVIVDRQIIFQGKQIAFGGVLPVQVLRLFRYGSGRCEERWMDEHIKVKGPSVRLPGNLIDENLNSLSWWVDKHNHYASREAVDLLNLEYNFIKTDSVASLSNGSEASFKRWVKENIYAKLPLTLRSLSYFLYRYILRLGFLDGRSGATFHILQGFWYRYLVDAKVTEVKLYAKKNDVQLADSIEAVLNIRVEKNTMED
jgi:glycosyltransferase involved in cell wall biosynthesis